jgi:hypothetical protein
MVIEITHRIDIQIQATHLSSAGYRSQTDKGETMTTIETKEITNSEDVIDVRDVIARVEHLESQPTKTEGGDHCAWCCAELKDDDETHSSDCEILELPQLAALLDELRGNDGDEEWRGDWYPLLLVRDSHFRDFAQQEAEDLDLVKSDARWPYTCIDWEQAARELQVDYSTVEFDGVTYWYR